MAWLPVIERELRVTARRRATHILRVGAGAIAMIVWMVCLWGASQMPPTALGHWLFVWVSSLLLGGCILSGAFITSDVLSEEKRSGTLGLLFLTPLKIHELLFGKLVSCSLHAVFALVAALPVLALPLLMGGVTFGEFVRVITVLLLTIFWSCSIGLFESAGTADAQKSLGRTLAWTIGLSGILPLIYWLLDSFSRGRWHSLLLWPSPGFAFRNALHLFIGGGPRLFAVASGCVLITALAFLTGSLIRLRRLVHDDSVESTSVRMRYRSPLRLGARNPFYWLTSRSRWPLRVIRWSFAILLSIAGIAYVLGLLSPTPVPFPLMISFISLYVLHQFFKLTLSIEASRQMNQDRHSGALELILATPLPFEMIVRGQISSLRARFEGAAVVLTIANVLALVGTLAAARHFGLNQSEGRSFPILMALGGAILLWADCYALSWVGIWKGLLARKHHRAVLSSVVSVMGAPWCCIFLLFAGVADRINSEREALRYIATWMIFSVGLDLILARRAQRQLRLHFREIIAEGKPRASSVRKASRPPEDLAIPRVELK